MPGRQQCPEDGHAFVVVALPGHTYLVCQKCGAQRPFARDKDGARPAAVQNEVR